MLTSGPAPISILLIYMDNMEAFEGGKGSLEVTAAGQRDWPEDGERAWVEERQGKIKINEWGDRQHNCQDKRTHLHLQLEPSPFHPPPTHTHTPWMPRNPICQLWEAVCDSQLPGRGLPVESPPHLTAQTSARHPVRRGRSTEQPWKGRAGGQVGDGGGEPQSKTKTMIVTLATSTWCTRDVFGNLLGVNVFLIKVKLLVNI